MVFQEYHPETSVRSSSSSSTTTTDTSRRNPQTAAIKTTTTIHQENTSDGDKGSISSQNNRDTTPNGLPNEEEEERRYNNRNRALNRKLDIFMLPFLSFLYLFSGMDRGNVGNAETEGEDDIYIKPLEGFFFPLLRY